MKYKIKKLLPGILFVVVQVYQLINYNKTGCLEMPQVPTVCGESAKGYLVAVFIFLGIGIYLIIDGLEVFKSKTKK